MNLTARAHENPLPKILLIPPKALAVQRSLRVDSKNSRKTSRPTLKPLLPSREMCRAGNLLESFTIGIERKAKMFIMSSCCLEGNKADRGRARRALLCCCSAHHSPRRAKVSEENLFLIQISYLRDQECCFLGVLFLSPDCVQGFLRSTRACS